MPKKNLLRYIFNVLSGIVICTIILYSVINFYLSKKIGKSLQVEIQKQMGKAYVLSIGEITTNWITMSVELDNVRLMAADLFKDNDVIKYNISANTVSLKALDLLAYYNNKLLLAKELKFDGLSIAVFKPASKPFRPGIFYSGDTLDLYKVIASKLNCVKINYINMSNAHLKFYQSPVYHHAAFSLEENIVRITNFSINKEIHQLQRLIFGNIVDVKLDNVSYKLDAKLPNYQADDKYNTLNTSYTNILQGIDSSQVYQRDKKNIF